MNAESQRLLAQARREANGEKPPRKKRGAVSGEFWSRRLLQTRIVERVLARMGVDPADFATLYVAMARSSFETTDAQRVAVDAYLKHGNLRQLAKDLGVSSSNTYSVLARVLRDRELARMKR